MSNPILYLISKYTGREQASVDENIKAWLDLNAKGYHVFSPITHSHCIEQKRQLLITYKTNSEFKCIRTEDFKQPDYVAQDIAYLTAWLQHDSCLKLNNKMIMFACEPDICKKHDCYDSGVIGVVLPSALEFIPDPTGDDSGDVINWKSSGAQKEYTWMKAHHVLIITLDTALNQPPEQWEALAL